MFETINTNSWNLHMLDTDKWRIQGDKTDSVGSFVEIVIIALRLGFNIKDIELGVDLILESGMDSVHFGMYKRPIFAFNRHSKVA